SVGNGNQEVQQALTRNIVPSNIQARMLLRQPTSCAEDDGDITEPSHYAGEPGPLLRLTVRLPQAVEEDQDHLLG
ncbi:hypothetical protein OC846_006899, partial [Tilletia horrida]